MSKKDEKLSPKLGQGEEVNLEDESSSPNLGQGEEVVLTSGEVINSETPPKTGQGEEEESPASKLQTFMKKKGIKDPDDIVDLYENVEKQNTKLSTQIRGMNFAPTPTYPTAPQPKPDERRQKADLEIPDDPSDLLYDGKKFKQFLTDYRELVRDETLSEVEKRDQEREQKRLFDRVVGKMKEDPEKFETLRPTMIHLSAQHPGADLDWLYEEADKIHQENEEKRIADLRQKLGLPDVPPERLSVMQEKNRPAPISDGDGVTGADLANPNAKYLKNAKALKEAIFEAETLDA